MMTEWAGGSSANPLGAEKVFCGGGPGGTNEGGREERLPVGGGDQPCLVARPSPGRRALRGVDGRLTGAAGGDGSRSHDGEGMVAFLASPGVGFPWCSEAVEVCWVLVGNLGSGPPMSVARTAGPVVPLHPVAGAPRAGRPSSVEGGVG